MCMEECDDYNWILPGQNMVCVKKELAWRTHAEQESVELNFRLTTLPKHGIGSSKPESLLWNESRKFRKNIFWTRTLAHIEFIGTLLADPTLCSNLDIFEEIGKNVFDQQFISNTLSLCFSSYVEQNAHKWLRSHWIANRDHVRHSVWVTLHWSPAVSFSLVLMDMKYILSNMGETRGAVFSWNWPHTGPTRFVSTDSR